MTKVFLEKIMIDRNGLSTVAIRKQEEQRKRQQQRIDYALSKMPINSTKVANDEVNLTQKHYKSMSDALAEVRKNKTTHQDTTQVVRPNSSGFHK